MSKVPIWAVAAPGARKPRFTREQIARAALALADADGFEALSMRRIAEALGAGTMTLYYYLRTKEDLLELVEDALLGEIADACEPLPRAWRSAVSAIATATRAACLRHPWALHALTGARLGPNGLRHIEQSLQAVAGLHLPVEQRLEILSILDDYVFGHCASLAKRRGQPKLDRKATHVLNETLRRHLGEGDYPHLRALIGDGDPVDVLATQGLDAEEGHFEVGLAALTDGLAKRFKLK